MVFLSTLIAVSGIFSATLVQAHMQMSSPFPINSPLNTAVPEAQKDYSYTSPLGIYPCKGYHTQTPVMYTASYKAGQDSQITLAGSASHGGGSCQISLSYDNGVTFKVIKSMMGGCPLVDTYGFTIPAFAPTGDALLAWSWFNKIGNREIYMDCAWVQISNGASKSKRALRRDASSFNALPNIFVANVPAADGVTTIEGDEVTFPYPGSNIQYGGSITASTPLGQGYIGTPPVQNFDSVSGYGSVNGTSSISDLSSAIAHSGITSSNPGSVTHSVAPSATPGSNSSGSNTAPPAIASSNPDSSSPTTAIPVITAGIFAASPDTTVANSNTTASATTSPNSSGVTSQSSSDSAPCTPGLLLCPSPTTWALCNADGTATEAQPVAPGTQCSNGNIILADNFGACDAPVGTWLCRDGGQSFSACVNGIWINMGHVAGGTTCQDGEIVATDL